jgi:hypothetical protein
MLVRAIALSLALLVGIGVIIPLATDTTEAGPRKATKKKKRGWKGVKKYSKRWWQLYRAQERRKRSLRARKRNLKLRQMRLAAARAANPDSPDAKPLIKRASSVTAPTRSVAAVLPSGAPAPAGWKQSQANSAEMQFRVDNLSGAQVGSASISVVGPAVQSGMAGSNNRSVGGVATTSLRREVIDRMIRENGWVVNDYQKQISGQQVYVVEAQSQAKNGSVQSRMFYFTEVDGRIYSVATNSPVNESTRLAEESEKVINSLKSRVRPAQRASLTD